MFGTGFPVRIPAPTVCGCSSSKNILHASSSAIPSNQFSPHNWSFLHVLFFKHSRKLLLLPHSVRIGQLGWGKESCACSCGLKIGRIELLIMGNVPVPMHRASQSVSQPVKMLDRIQAST